MKQGQGEPSGRKATWLLAKASGQFLFKVLFPGSPQTKSMIQTGNDESLEKLTW